MSGSPDIVCGEQGFEGEGRTSARFDCAPDDLRELRRRHAAKDLVLREVEGARFVVEGRAACGVIRLPSGRRVEIRTKLPVGALIDWLVFVGAIPVLQHWGQGALLGAGCEPGSALIGLFLGEVEAIVRFHRRPGYLREARLSPGGRGTLDVRQLAKTAAHLPVLPVHVRGRSMDSLANRVIAAGLARCAQLVPMRPDHAWEPLAQRLSVLAGEWSDVPGALRSPQLDATTALLAPPIGYRTALELARLLMTGVQLDREHGSGGDAFIVNLARVWEEAVRRIAAAWASSSDGWGPLGLSERTRTWDDGTQADEPADEDREFDQGADDPARPRRPMFLDAGLRDAAGRLVVLDAKYKRVFGRESRMDRFQMAAYALAFDGAVAALVYPAEGARETERVRLLKGTGSPPREIWSMGLPIEEGPAACMGVFTHHMNALSKRCRALVPQGEVGMGGGQDERGAGRMK